jgi:hypothetical protein
MLMVTMFHVSLIILSMTMKPGRPHLHSLRSTALRSDPLTGAGPLSWVPYAFSGWRTQQPDDDSKSV